MSFPPARRRVATLCALAALALTSGLVLGGPAHGSGEPELLPNLVADPPDNAQIEVSADEGGIAKTAGEAKLLLRFNGYVHNDGSGPLEIEGQRSTPQVQGMSEAEVEQKVEEVRSHNQEAEAKEESDLWELSPALEQALAVPAMQVGQGLFATNAGAPQTNPERQSGESQNEYQERLARFGEENENYLKRPSQEKPISAQMEYVNADGHHHWHLERVAKYSLWNAQKTAEVAPSQKVGFCLEDSERVEETDAAGQTGPAYPVYADSSPPYRDFCQQYRPNSTFVFEGVSPGWRDRYDADLGFQWVDISDVAPGEYWLREEVNPEHRILEEGRGQKVGFATQPTIVPGFDAVPQTVDATEGQPLGITVTASRWEDGDEPTFRIVSPTQHGELTLSGSSDEVLYHPNPGYSGIDSFSFYAYDQADPEFPRDPTLATVSINVGKAVTPSVAIDGAPRAMVAGTSVQLSASVLNDDPKVTWSASAGAITQRGLFTAPAKTGTAVVKARTAKGAEARVAIQIKPLPAQSASPAAGSSRCTHPTRPSGLCRPDAALMGRELVVSTRVTKPGRLDVSVRTGHRLLGGCHAAMPANWVLTCRSKLPGSLSLRSAIAVSATLQSDHRLLRDSRPSAPVSQMKMSGAHASAASVGAGLRAPSSWRFWCSPSMVM